MNISDLDMSRVQYFPESHDRVRVVIPLKSSLSLEEKLVGKKNSKSLKEEIIEEIVKHCSVV